MFSKKETPSSSSSSSSSSFHPYLKVPPVLRGHIASFFNQRDLACVNQALGRAYLQNTGNNNNNAAAAAIAASSVSALLPSAQTPMQHFNQRYFQILPTVGKLLNAVQYADYSQAEMAIATDPSLMFQPVNFLYSDGSRDCISPLQYAFKVYDTYMWKMFYERIKENPAYRHKFLEQALAQTTHIDLEPLFTAYEKYERQYQRWLSDKIKDPELDAEWFKLGKVQKAILPVHMLKEFSREGDGWNASSAFDVKALPLPRNCRLYNYMTGVWNSLSSTLSDLGWGSCFTLIRGAADCRAGLGGRVAMLWLPGVSIGAGRDLATFRRLFEVRTKDLAKQLSLLLQNSLEIQEQKNQSSSSSSAGRATL